MSFGGEKQKKFLARVMKTKSRHCAHSHTLTHALLHAHITHEFAKTRRAITLSLSLSLTQAHFSALSPLFKATEHTHAHTHTHTHTHTRE